MSAASTGSISPLWFASPARPSGVRVGVAVLVGALVGIAPVAEGDELAPTTSYLVGYYLAAAGSARTAP